MSRKGKKYLEQKSTAIEKYLYGEDSLNYIIVQ